MKDLPPVTSGLTFLQRVREVLQIFMGKGDPNDRLISLGELKSVGLVDDKGSTLTPGPAVGVDDEPDLTPPPTPTGVTVTAAITNLIIETDEAAYTVGHGHDRTIVYGAQYSGAGPLPTFSDAVELTQFVGTIFSYATNPATQWHLWLKWKSVDGVLSTSPSGGTNGHTVTTATDVTLLLDALAGEISESELTSALGTRIDLIDAPSSTAGSVNARILTETNARTAAIAAEATARGTAITNEATLRQAGDDALALQVSLITAGVAGGFDYGDIWYFDTTVEGWTSTGATQAHNAGWVELTSTGSDPAFISPSGLGISGAQYPIVKARVRRLAGAEASWDGTCYYVTGGHGISSSYRKTISVPTPFDVGDTAIVEFAMDDLTAGGTDWVTSTIDQIRLDFGADSSDVIAVDWVAIGRNAPGASVAGLLSEQQARISGDDAIVTDLTALTARVDTAEADIVTEATARADGDTANATLITALDSRVDDAEAAITSEATTRATADTALSSSISSVSAVANAKNKTYSQTTAPASGMVAGDIWFDSDDGNKAYRYSGSSWVATDDARIATNAAAITTEATARANADTSLASQITTLSATANAKNRSYAQTTAPSTGLVAGDIWFDTDDNNKAYRYNGTSWVATDDARIAANAAAITTEASARASADSALASQITVLESEVDTNTAAIATEATARADGDDALASQITVLQSTVDDNTAAIATESTARADGDDALASQITTLTATVGDNTVAIAEEASVRANETGHLGTLWTLRMTTGDIVGGIGLSGTSGGTAGSTVDFGVRANKFYVVPPEGVSNTGAAVFTYLSVPTAVNGVMRPAGLYVSDAFIGEGVISNAKIGELAVDTAKIADAAITTAKIADAQITSAKIEDAAIQSAHIDDAAIQSAHIDDAAIITAHIADAAITSAKIDTLDAAKIIAGTITTDKLVANAATVAATGNSSVTQITFGNSIPAPVTESTGLTLTTTGAPVKYSASVMVGGRIWRTVLSHVTVHLTLEIDGFPVSFVVSGTATPTLYSGAILGVAANFNDFQVTLPIDYRTTSLSAGSHTFKVEASAQVWLASAQTSSSTWGTAPGGQTNILTLRVMSYAEENKV